MKLNEGINEGNKVKEESIVKEKQNAKGITLIALIITIIILLILAAVTLNITIGDNGIITKTKLAKIYTEKSEAEEMLLTKIANVQINNKGQATLRNLLEAFKTDNEINILEIKTETETITDINTEIEENTLIKEITVQIKGYEQFNFTIGENLEITHICGIEKAKVAYRSFS